MEASKKELVVTTVDSSSRMTEMTEVESARLCTSEPNLEQYIALMKSEYLAKLQIAVNNKRSRRGK
jgi:hypothetical protein